MPNRGPELELPIVDRRDRRSASTSASSEEAAAVVAALERFMRATAPAATDQRERLDPWHRAALIEGVSREPRNDDRDPWINT